MRKADRSGLCRDLLSLHAEKRYIDVYAPDRIRMQFSDPTYHSELVRNLGQIRIFDMYAAAIYFFDWNEGVAAARRRYSRTSGQAKRPHREREAYRTSDIHGSYLVSGEAGALEDEGGGLFAQQ